MCSCALGTPCLLEGDSKIFVAETRPTWVIDFIGSAVEFINKNKSRTDQRELKKITWRSKTPKNVILCCLGCSIPLEMKHLIFSRIWKIISKEGCISVTKCSERIAQLHLDG